MATGKSKKQLEKKTGKTKKEEKKTKEPKDQKKSGRGYGLRRD